MSDKKRVQLEFSAGGVLYRTENGKVEVVLIATKDSTAFSLPKGNIEKKEKPEEAAVREVFEETGCMGKVIEPLEKIEYWYVRDKVKVHKFVYYYLMEFLHGDTSNHDEEVNEAFWIEIDKAIEKISYKNEREILIKARERIKNRNS